jgi:dihydroorotase
MLIFKNILTVEGARVDVPVPLTQDRTVDASQYLLLPALTDPHVHFRVPGSEHKEDWRTGARAAIAGGVTTVLDMPNNHPACTTLERVREKKRKIQQQLAEVGIPLRFGLYLGADRRFLDEIKRARSEVIALKIYMGSSTGDLLMEDRASLEEAFSQAAAHDLLVAVHAEDEQLIQLHQRRLSGANPALHSQIRNSDVAARAVALAIALARKTGARLYIVHTSTKAELALIREAKREGLPVFAEAAPHHLFLNTAAYARIGTMALVNPPLRDNQDQEALWEALRDGTIDTIGTDHAPHTLAEKQAPYGRAPSGFPSIELYLPLLLQAYHEGKISLAQIVRLTHTGPRALFGLEPHQDFVIVDLHRQKTVTDAMLHTKAKWSPYAGLTLTGWPRYTILENRLYDLELW